MMGLYKKKVGCLHLVEEPPPEKYARQLGPSYQMVLNNPKRWNNGDDFGENLQETMGYYGDIAGIYWDIHGYTTTWKV
jgi:hypothetical protein